jgi:CIC family chloride channel protein
MRPILKSMPRWTQYFQPAIAGLIVGSIAILGAPQVMGAGYDFIDEAIHNQFTWSFLGILVGLKILATIISFVSGTPGGMFAPTLFIGAMLGAFVAGVEHLVLPHLAISTGTYAMVGMGVLFAGFLRAPMTSVFMVLEVSGNYTIILPVIVANTFAYVISRALQPTPIFDLLTRQDGLDLPSMEEQREQSILRVEDAMRRVSDPVLDAGQPLKRVVQQLDGVQSVNLLVRMPSRGWNTITLPELRRILAEGKGELSLKSVLPIKQIPYLHPDHPLDLAMRYIHRYPVLPVVSRADVTKLEGIVSKEDVLKSYHDLGEALDETE